MNVHQLLRKAILENNGIINLREVELKARLNSLANKLAALEAFKDMGIISDTKYHQEIDKLTQELLTIKEDYLNPPVNTYKTPRIPKL